MGQHCNLVEERPRTALHDAKCAAFANDANLATAPTRNIATLRGDATRAAQFALPRCAAPFRALVVASFARFANTALFAQCGAVRTTATAAA